MYVSREGHFISFDKTELFYRAWTPQNGYDRTVILLHRGHEHSGRVAHMVEELKLEKTRYFSFDLRGHGKSPGARGWAPNFDTWVNDLNAFSVFLRREQGVEMDRTFVIANSVGSVMAAQWIHDFSPGVRGMVLAAPAFSIKLYIPLALTMLRLVSKMTNKLFVTSYVKSKLLTRDKKEAEGYDADKLITKRIAVSVLVSLFDSAKRLIQDARAIETPTLVLSAGSDFIVRNNIQKTFLDRVSAPQKKFVHLEGFRHALFHETDREKVLQPIRDFVQESYAEVKSNLPMAFPEPKPYSVAEVETLASKPAPLKALQYAVMRKMLVTLGPLSRGMALGLEQGFDSGASLDYVYRNKPEGKFVIGKVADYFYLHATGWKGIRQRKNQLRQTLEQALHEIHSRGEKPVVMDCAAGHGRYLYEAVTNVPFDVSLRVRDINPLNLENSKKLSEEFKLKDCTYTQVDAFDEAQYKNLEFQPNIVIVSGLFELFSDNRMLFKTLKGIQSVLKPGGYIIYTGQPWHPQLETIARLLNNHRGTRWIMRARVQAELDALVKYVGFQKLDTAVDGLGIFTVSTAQKQQAG